MWRCFCVSVLVRIKACIFSTYVEVFLLPKPFAGRFRNFLHVCGGVSSGYLVPFFVDEFSPRMWRCFFVKVTTTVAGTIFSTYVEVFLMLNRGALNGGNFLHVCGGVSPPDAMPFAPGSFSPRMWRCFHHFDRRGGHGKIFSTYVEVFPRAWLQSAPRCNFLHVCGGVSVLDWSLRAQD